MSSINDALWLEDLLLTCCVFLFFSHAPICVISRDGCVQKIPEAVLGLYLHDVMQCTVSIWLADLIIVCIRRHTGVPDKSGQRLYRVCHLPAKLTQFQANDKQIFISTFVDVHLCAYSAECYSLGGLWEKQGWITGSRLFRATTPWVVQAIIIEHVSVSKHNHVWNQI